MSYALSRKPDFLLDRLLYRDGLMLVIDKPAGIVVHPNPGKPRGAGDESLEDYFDALRFGLPRLPALAHRLDRDTTGCLVLGRHPKALRKLHKLFFEGKVDKTYLAICRGAPEKPSGSINAAMRKANDKSGWRMEVCDEAEEGALTAATTYRTIASGGGYTVIEAKPKTGRTHQIRVHLAHVGAPIIGDPRYGDLSTEDRKHPMMLHAKRVVIPISKNKDPVSIAAAPPETMAKLLTEIG